MMETLHLDERLAAQIQAHGAETYPHECCGALLGHDGGRTRGDSTGDSSREVLDLYALVNRRDDSPRNRFAVTAEDVRDADMAAQKQGLEVIGWYHSHPDHPARPSQYDQDHAWPWYSYVIVSIENGSPQEMTSWRLADDRHAFSPEGIEIRHSATV